MRETARLLAILAGMLLAACGQPPESRPIASVDEIHALEKAIVELGPDVDLGEAARAAKIAYEYTRELAIAYEITDPPLIHNTKVNMGLRPRGLCWHWAEDVEKRLLAEKFETLDILRAIANADRQFRIDHSTALVAAKGDTIHDAIVIDPWRFGGTLFWSETNADTRYKWVPQADVLEWKLQQFLAEGQIPQPS
ncbi:MAG: hypothetical protein ACR2OY_11085 [Boseongicola sp.]